MTKLPDYPDYKLISRTSPALLAPEGLYLWRVYFRGGDHPTKWDEFRCFGPVDSRFDHHVLDTNSRPYVQHRGIMYASEDAATAIAEVFQNNKRSIDPTFGKPWIAKFCMHLPLWLLDLNKDWPISIGASSLLATGPKDITRRWSRAFYDCYPQIDGVCFPSSMTNTTCIALYERAAGALLTGATLVFDSPLADINFQRTLEGLGRKLNYTIESTGST